MKKSTKKVKHLKRISIALSKPKISKSAEKYVLEALRTGMISKGPCVELLEQKFSHAVGYRFSSAVSSGTMALYIALKAIDVGRDDEVIIPALTFAATADAVIMAGATPVFADVDERALCLSHETVKPHITPKTKAIITVGLYGMPAFIGSLKGFNLPIICDSAESLGSDQREFALMSCYSFFGNKVMTTGEGGMISTNTPELKKKIDLLRNHGRMLGSFLYTIQGTNGRMSNIQAAIGLSQLEDIGKNLEKRRQVLEWYGMSKSAIKFMAPWMMISRHKNRRKLLTLLREKGIEVRAGFYPLHKMPAYSQNISLPVSEKLGQEILLLPCHPDLTQSDIKKICNILLSVQGKSAKPSKKSSSVKPTTRKKAK